MIPKTVPILLLLFFATASLAQECKTTAEGAQICDRNEKCQEWQLQGECSNNPKYMRDNCPASCYVPEGCKDYHLRCPVWAQLGECTDNEENMKKFCAVSCGVCENGAADVGNVCVDQNEQCPGWARNGECESNPGYMESNCAKSCGTCATASSNNKTKAGRATNMGSVSPFLSEEDRQMVEETVEFGDLQEVSGYKDQVEQTMKVIREATEYMATEFVSLSEEQKDKCLNRNELCAFWASMEECEKNEEFMQYNCAPCCKSCHLLGWDE